MKTKIFTALFQERKFDSEKEFPEDFIVDLQRLALRAFPNIAAGPGGVPAAVDWQTSVLAALRKHSFKECP